MTLKQIKKEFKKSIEYKKMDKRDYNAYVKEINETTTLDEFISVVELWAIDIDDVGIGKLILNRIVEK